LRGVNQDVKERPTEVVDAKPGGGGRDFHLNQSQSLSDRPGAFRALDALRVVYCQRFLGHVSDDVLKKPTRVPRAIKMTRYGKPIKFVVVVDNGVVNRVVAANGGLDLIKHWLAISANHQ
jgi:hypothetical protein